MEVQYAKQAICLPRGRFVYVEVDMIDLFRPHDWTFETKVISVYDSFFRKSISIVYCLSLL